MSTVKDYYIGINTIFKFSKQRLRAPKIGPTILVPSAHSVLSHQTKKIKKVMPNRAKLPRGKDQMVPTQLFSLSLLLSLPNSPAFSHFHCLSLCLSHHRVDWPRTQLWVKVNLFILFRSACKIWFFFFHSSWLIVFIVSHSHVILHSLFGSRENCRRKTKNKGRFFSST